MKKHPRRACAAATAVVAAAALAAGLLATGSGAATTPQLAIITAAANQNAFQEMADGAITAGSQFGDSVKNIAPPQIDPATEVSEFQQAEQTSKDGIATMTTAPPSFKVPFADAEKRGIPVVAVDSAPVPGSNVKTFVGNDNFAVGAAMANQLIKKIPVSATGTVVVGNDIPQLPLLGLRIAGMEAVIKKDRPKLKLTQTFNVTANPSSNLSSWESLVNKYPNAVAYIAPGDQDAVSFLTISRQNHKHYLVGACDVDPVALQAVQEGYVDVLGDPEHFLKGYLAIWVLNHYARTHKLITGWWNPGDGVITQANINSILTREKSNANRYAFYKAILTKETANPSAYLKPLSAAGGN